MIRAKLEGGPLDGRHMPVAGTELRVQGGRYVWRSRGYGERAVLLYVGQWEGADDEEG